jgi:hypothetical protein
MVDEILGPHQRVAANWPTIRYLQDWPTKMHVGQHSKRYHGLDQP